MAGPNWIKKAIKPQNKGALHRQLGVPEDETISENKLEKAEEAGGTLAKRARFAETLKGFHKKSPFGKVKVGGK